MLRAVCARRGAATRPRAALASGFTFYFSARSFTSLDFMSGREGATTDRATPATWGTWVGKIRATQSPSFAEIPTVESFIGTHSLPSFPRSSLRPRFRTCRAHPQGSPRLCPALFEPPIWGLGPQGVGGKGGRNLEIPRFLVFPPTSCWPSWPPAPYGRFKQCRNFVAGGTFRFSFVFAPPRAFISGFLRSE